MGGLVQASKDDREVGNYYIIIFKKYYKSLLIEYLDLYITYLKQAREELFKRLLKMF